MLILLKNWICFLLLLLFFAEIMHFFRSIRLKVLCVTQLLLHPTTWSKFPAPLHRPEYIPPAEPNQSQSALTVYNLPVESLRGGGGVVLYCVHCKVSPTALRGVERFAKTSKSRFFTFRGCFLSLHT